jgi:hypothetical protein
MITTTVYMQLSKNEVEGMDLKELEKLMLNLSTTGKLDKAPPKSSPKKGKQAA